MQTTLNKTDYLKTVTIGSQVWLVSRETGLNDAKVEIKFIRGRIIGVIYLETKHQCLLGTLQIVRGYNDIDWAFRKIA
jgi:hypothetical protein